MAWRFEIFEPRLLTRFFAPLPAPASGHAEAPVHLCVSFWDEAILGFSPLHHHNRGGGRGGLKNSLGLDHGRLPALGLGGPGGGGAGGAAQGIGARGREECQGKQVK